MVSNLYSYQASLAFLVSGQAQHGFNFFSGSFVAVVFVSGTETVAEAIFSPLPFKFGHL